MKQRVRLRENCELYPEWKDFQKFKEWSLQNGYDDGKMICRNGDVGNYEPNNVRWDTQLSNNIEAHALSWLVTDPDGNEKDVYNLAAFCHNIEPNSTALKKGLHIVANGRQNEYKGWKCIKK